MQLEQLNLNRNLFKSEPDPVYSGSAEISASNNNGTPQNSILGDKSGEKEANQVVTGTVITDCIIKTSPGANRIELAGNNLDFYNDTFFTTTGHPVGGDTSSLNFIRSDDSTKFFRMENRVSVNDDFDNVLSWYASPPFADKHNWLFIGRNGDINDPNFNIGNITFNVDYKSGHAYSAGNGSFLIYVTKDGGSSGITGREGIAFMAGDTRFITAGAISGGFSSYINGGNGGVCAMAYDSNPLIYLVDDSGVVDITFVSNIIPGVNNTYDIGSPSSQVKNIYFGGDIYTGATKGIDATFQALDADGTTIHQLIFSNGLLIHHNVV